MENSSMRLSQVAVKLNIGVKTITEFFTTKKIKINSDPNTLLNSEHIKMLVRVFGDGDNTIETEDEEVSNDPFNPDEVSLDSKGFLLEGILRRLIQNTIKLDPDFQRNEVWNEEKKSQLIESLMLKIPLPMFYVSADEKANYTVVDGLQRLSTIRDFVLGKEYLKSKEEKERGKGFKLKNLEFWKDYENMTFKDLPTHTQNRILETELTFTIINPGTPEEVKRNIFKRINTGGELLSSQEIRNALYVGKCTELLKALAMTPEFQQATGGSIKSLRKEDHELILRFLAFLVRGYTTYKKTILVDTFLSDTMIIINAFPEFKNKDFQKIVAKGNVVMKDINLSNLENVRDLFKKGMIRSYELFGEHTFRKSYGNKFKAPINKSLFEMWGNLLAQLPDEKFEKLRERKADFMETYTKLLEDNQFHIFISRDSMKTTAVQQRFSQITNLINQFAQ